MIKAKSNLDLAMIKIMIKYTEKEFKSILNKRKFIDSWFLDRYSINAYNGCQFGCIYCDSDEDLESMVKTAKESGADYLLFGAGMNIQNLKESLTDLATRNELRKIRNVSSDIENFIREQLLNYS